ncbi:MAG: hypothetical protein J5964_04315 [Eubacterium sp.]|nr:hypothetical protein [Eubacterium sp.]
MFKKGKTILFDNPPVITGHAGLAGKKEGEGPLAEYFDMVFEDSSLGRKSFELAESAMLNKAISLSLDNAGRSPSELDFILSGDLLNQCVGSSFAVKEMGVPSIGMYGACSTMALTLATSAMLIDAGATCCAAAASSHFCSSERQFRYPLEYGGQRTPTAQWTVTGAGSAVVEKQPPDNAKYAKITAAHIGTITDLSISDPANMGAAMAPVSGRIRP